jgi:integrase
MMAGRYYDRAVERGILRRHDASCPAKDGGRCRCTPRYIARTTVDGQRRIAPTAPSLPEARKRLRALHDAGVQAVADSDRGPSVTDAFGTFVDDARAGIALNRSGRTYKPRALDDYVAAFGKHAKPTVGNRAIAAVTRGDVQALLDKLARDGVGDSRRHSVATALRALWKWAGARDLCDPDALAGLRMPALRRTKRRVLTPAQVTQVLKPLKGRTRLGYAIAAYTGARAQEVAALVSRDVDLERRTIAFGEDETARKTVAAQRLHPIVDELYVILAPAIEAMGPAIGLAPLFPGDTTPGRRADALRRDANDTWEAAFLPAVGMHDLRHTWLSWLMAAGVPLPVIRDLAGHAWAESMGAEFAGVTMNTYGHSLPGAVEQARKTMNQWSAAQRELPDETAVNA